MKKALIVLLSSFIAGLALNVQAANVTFIPGMVEYQAAPGEKGMKTIRTNGFSTRPYSLYLSLNSRSEGGNLPLEWLMPADVRLNSRTGGGSSAILSLGVRVPVNARPGRYTGVIMPKSLQSTEPVSSNGLVVRVEVTGPQSACTGLPTFTDLEIGPQGIWWAPSDRDVSVVISGSVSVKPGCEVTARYSFEDNDGMLSGDLLLNEDGSFAQELTANVSRSGKDKEGKIYNGMLYAEDEDGKTGEVGFYVTVMHDRGKKTGQDK